MRRGQVVIERFDSAVLAGNPLGDPAERELAIYLPPSYASDAARRFPVAVVLTGFSGRGRMLLNDNLWSPALNDRMDTLIDSGRAGEMILVMPDCTTRYGGSQYLGSSILGDYARYLNDELIEHVDARYRTLADRAHRGIMGKSSGGFGALVNAMRRPDRYGAVASHSGDMAFDFCYRADLPRLASIVSRAGGLRAWFDGFETRHQKSSDDHIVINILAMASVYSPNPAAPWPHIDFPLDLERLTFSEEIWRRWLAFDPIEMLASPANVDALRSLRLLHLDAGTRDEWCLHLGARRFTTRLAELGVAHEYEEFDDGHMNVGYRYDVSLPKMSRALGGG